MTEEKTTLLVGTTKGGFLITSDVERESWQVSGPHCNGWTINHIVGDADSGRIWAGGGGDWDGAGVWRSDDGGAHWELTSLTTGEREEWAAKDPDFAKMIGWEPGATVPFGKAFSQIWSLHAAHGRVFAGTKPACLLVSDDGGVSWQEIQALRGHSSAETWNPGAAGLVLHTLVSDPDDPDKLWIGISAAGVFASEDGGVSFERRNRLANAAACADHPHPAAPRDGEVGHCVHNMQRASDGRLYQQNHHGVWRSNDGGRSWEDIGAGLPSTFGFPLHVHPRDPDVIWTLPLNGDSAGRYPPDAAAAIWRSTDGGTSWHAQRNGLPQENCFFTVLRQAMAGDWADPAGVYFGTNTGSIFATRDEGETWHEIVRHLPTVLSVEVMPLT